MFKGFVNLYEEQGAGIASNMMTFFKIQRNLFGFSLFIAPLCIKDVGLFVFTIGILYACFINLLCVWLLSKSERRFRNEFFMITNLHDLTYLCFSDWVIVFQQLIRFLQCITLLVVINYYLSIQTDQIMCHTFDVYQCGKSRDYQIRIAINVLLLFTFMSGYMHNLRVRKMINVFSYLLMIIILCLFLFHSYIMYKNQTIKERDVVTSQIFNMEGRHPQQNSINGTLF